MEEFQSSETAQQLMDLERKESVLRMLHQVILFFILLISLDPFIYMSVVYTDFISLPFTSFENGRRPSDTIQKRIACVLSNE